MDLSTTCCSVDKNELAYPSFSVVFIHTFMLDGDVAVKDVKESDKENLAKVLKKMREALKPDPDGKVRPVSSLVEYINNNKKEGEADIYIEYMDPEVEGLLFPMTVLNSNNVARYSMHGFDFRIPVRASKEKNSEGEYEPDFSSIDFEGHVNVEVSQFLGNIFSVTYRFLFDGYTCRILEPDETDNKGLGSKDRNPINATTNHLISLVSSCLGAEYWSDDDEDDELSGIDLRNRLVIDKIWVDYYGRVIERDKDGNSLNPVPQDKDNNVIKEELEDKGIWTLESQGRVFDNVLLRYKKYIAREFLGDMVDDEYLKSMSVVNDSRYAMVDIWETVKHPFGSSGKRDLFSDNHWPKLGEAGIINHIRDYHKPEMVGLMTMYPAEWPYRAAEAYDDVCGENIAIDTDDLVLAGSHMVVVIGTYGRRGDGVDGVNWKKVMRERRFYHVSWEEYLLIVQLVLAKKYTFRHAVDKLLGLTEDMSEVTKKTIGECSKQVLLASKKAIELDVIKHMKFPSHKVMYDRTMHRLDLEADFQRFKDVQEVVNDNLQSLGESHAAEADYFMNKLLIGISVLSLVELAFQQSEWPFVEKIFACGTPGWDRVASLISGVAAAIVGGVAIYGIFYGGRKLYRKWKKRKK